MAASLGHNFSAGEGIFQLENAFSAGKCIFLKESAGKPFFFSAVYSGGGLRIMNGSLLLDETQGFRFPNPGFCNLR